MFVLAIIFVKRNERHLQDIENPETKNFQ